MMSDIDVGACGCLQGLEKSPHLNGRRAVVVDTDMLNKTGRVAVHLFPKKQKNKSLLVKIHNLKLDRVFVDDCGSDMTRCKGRIEFCNHCCASCKDIKVCGKCRVTAYCSRECQVQHWKMGHRKECSSTKEVLAKESFSSGCDLTKMSEKELRDRVEVTFAKVAVYRDKGKWLSAEKVLRATIDVLQPVEEKHPSIMASLYGQLAEMIGTVEGRIDEAVTAMEHAVALETNVPILCMSLVNLGFFLKKQGDYERSITACWGAYEVWPEEMQVVPPCVADMYMRMHNHDKAEEVLCKSLKILGQNLDTEDQRKTVAEIHGALGTVRADRFFNQSLRLYKSAAYLHSNTVQRETGQFLQNIRTAMELYPDNPSYSDQMVEYKKMLLAKGITPSHP